MTKKMKENRLLRGFTLDEGTPCIENLTCVARHAKKVVKAPCIENLTCVTRHAFTLAEVLIVIGVIGVVAAITIPTLINTISKNAKKAQTDVIEARLLDGINRYSATEDGLSQKHASTYDFLIGLSNHYKMAQICKADEIEKCIPYSKIHSADGKSSVNVSSLKTIDKFVPAEAVNNYLEPASFISAQGTPVVMVLKKNCVWDTGQAMKSIEDSRCIAYLYDKNGTSLPNRLGDNSDIVSHGITIGGFPLAILGGVKIMTNAFTTTALTASDCNENKGTYGIDTCTTGANDCWGGAMKECKEQGLRLPTETELANIANALYIGMNASSTDNFATNMYGSNNASIGSNEPVPDALSGLGSSWSSLWSSSERKNNFSAIARHFRATYSNRDFHGRGDCGIRAVCVSD